MTIRIRPASKTSEKGTAIVEAAVILLILFMLIFGVFEAGRFMNTQQVLTNAAREGARFAIAPTTQTNTVPTDTEIETRIQQYLDSAGIPCASCVTVTRPVLVATGSVQTSYTEVVVTNPYQVLTIPGFFNVLQVTLSGDALMRNETSD
jgi:Flp pilus assembly protein TadG